MARKKKVKEVEVESPKVEEVKVEAPKEEKPKAAPRKKKEELKTSDVTSVTEAGIVSTQKAPPVPLTNRKIVPHLLVQEVQSLRNEVDTLKLQVKDLLAAQAKK